MVVLRNSVLIRCTPEEAFDHLSDLRAELEWNPKCQVMEKITEGPVGKGTKYRAKWKSSPYVEVEIIHHDRPRTWTAHNGGPIEVTFSARLEPAGQDTVLHAEFTPRPHGWFRLIFPLFLLVIRREEKTNMIHLRTALERRARNRR
ncbi:polyketide cyclase/dehydrase/lipid transport protein [Lentzea atacamensis]|uniref:Polyketide cyclase/dehydrase/lipid transport protein n=1 Tax=Lentzea atacamensis TaxID=531938 RepID=A0A316HLM4_9PSEU|nr:SRPBCC family protein [Lentzea atacamensis]PWK80955.1 polyketide cyclase/dehydrase/lipid transport protein [Lentzea atacamensis]